jgi:hypothetical protein
VTHFHGFLAGLIATVAVLAAVVATGMLAKRRLHIPLVATFFAVLAFTIVKAVQMGQSLDVEQAGWITPFHLTLARVNLFLFALPIATGVLTLRDARWRPKHRLCAWGLVGLTVLTVVTGTWMALASPVE